MKRNLLKGMIFISAVALSSCATLSDLSKSNTLGDDVYYTKAKAGIDNNYVPQYVFQQQSETVRNDDYYYYGDYESRIRRFNYSSPFNYNDDYYDYDYAAYAPVANQNNAGYAYSPDDYTYDPYYDDLGVYSAYDFGYGDYWGYDNYGYGIAYSTFVYTGGTRATHKKGYSYSNNHIDGPVFVRANSARGRYGNSAFGMGAHNNSGIASAGNTAINRGLSFSRAGAVGSSRNAPVFTGARPGGSNAVYPGRPGTNSVNYPTTNVAGANRPIRPAEQAPRAFTPRNTVETQRSSPPPQMSSPSNSNSSSGSSGGGGGSSAGGGGRPVRP